MRRVYKNLCPATISASIMAANVWKNGLKNVESDNNKILYEMLLDIFLQQNGTYFLNKSRNAVLGGIVPVGKVWPPLGPGLEERRMSVMASYPGTGFFL